MEDLYFAKHDDNRGSHMKFFTKDAEALGFGEMNEVFMTTNNRGTLRGLHRQTGDTPQQKIIKVVNGKFNVRVVYPKDLAMFENNSTAFSIYNNNATDVEGTSEYDTVLYFDNWDETKPPIFIPEGALLGYLALEDNSKMLYMADAPFNAEADEGFNPRSKRFNIGWNDPDNPVTEFFMSERDDQAKDY